MHDARTSQAREAAARGATNRRARRGLVAGYLHELSARHGTADERRAASTAAQPVTRPARPA